LRIPAVRGRLRNWHTFFPFVVELGYYNIVDKFHSKMSTTLSETKFTINGKDYSHRELNMIYDFFTQLQWDTIDSALDCYSQENGSKHNIEEECHQVRDVMYEVLRAAY